MSTISAQAAYPLEFYPEEYLPESDGKPMAETDDHRELMMDLHDALDEFYLDEKWIYVTANVFVYYRDEAGKMQSVSPDIMVVRGVRKKNRRIYNIEVEGKAPEMVIELTSTSTTVEDLVTKKYIYAKIGVKEYFIFDPYGETLRPPLRGFRLENGEYVPMADTHIGGTHLYSEVLGLELRVEDGQLRLYDPKTGERLLTRKEKREALRMEAAARREAEVKAAQELAAREAAEAKAAQELAARQAAEAKAAQELAARQAAESKAAHELAVRQAAEAELTRLREELAKLRRDKP
jgi:Uma2 family endonuclease